jgi:hypothetical protein
MTLSKLAKEVLGSNLKTALIGVYTKPGAVIEPEYADELLETHGDLEVGAWKKVRDDLLVVQFKSEEN